MHGCTTGATTGMEGGKGSADCYSSMIEQAIAWHVRIAAPDATDRTWQEFTDWLEQDPANRAAFNKIGDFDESFAIRIVNEETVESDMPLSTWSVARASARNPRATMIWTGVAAVSAAILLFEFIPAPSPAQATRFSTRVGETKTVALSDGSRIEMNTGTQLTVESSSRHVNLLRGEAIFSVQRDPDHPFTVTVADRQLRDLGTVFDVVRSHGKIVVAVAEGSVAVSPLDSAMKADANIMGPGDRAIYDERGGLASFTRVNPSDMLAWKQGYLVYKDAPLSAVVGDLNRYFQSPISISGPDSIRFSGILRIESEDAVIARISRLLPIMVDRRPDGTIILRPIVHRH